MRADKRLGPCSGLNMRPDVVAVRSTFTTLGSPVGELLLTSDGVALTGLYPLSHRALPAPSGLLRDDAHFSGVRDQLTAYFRGKLSEFTVPLHPAGTAFQQAVWREVRRIPCGTTRTCAELAAAMGRPGASGAVAVALGKNPVAILIPSHRVVGAAGGSSPSAGGTGPSTGGTTVQRWLLDHEASMLPWRRSATGRSCAWSTT